MKIKYAYLALYYIPNIFIRKSCDSIHRGYFETRRTSEVAQAKVTVLWRRISMRGDPHGLTCRKVYRSTGTIHTCLQSRGSASMCSSTKASGLSTQLWRNTCKRFREAFCYCPFSQNLQAWYTPSAWIVRNAKNWASFRHRFFSWYNHWFGFVVDIFSVQKPIPPALAKT